MMPIVKAVELPKVILNVWRGIAIVLTVWGVGFSIAAISLQHHFLWHDLVFIWGGILGMVLGLAVMARLLIWGQKLSQPREHVWAQHESDRVNDWQ
ncbi:hypothetical protein [Celerinatantimonas sp. YJH-8]|uniref:hypothetical protein n=1 Tax=Celerinatantimonas sp. YJH-8 TaxID=3228714 RepID=UPI0038C83756